MKLPFDLGVKLIFRLLVPGFFLTLGLYPALAALRDKAGWALDVEYLFVLSVIVTGWVVVILDQPVYMFLEGRRYWPPWLRSLFVSSERRRLARISEKFNKAYALSKVLTEAGEKGRAYQDYIEATVEQRKFPLDEAGRPYARFPTRLGNMVDAFESYPMKRYGVDAVFFWYRLWLTLDKDLREELDNRQAVADSAVYACVALFVTGSLWVVYWVLSLFGFTLLGHLPTFLPPWIPALGFLLASGLFYRMSLSAQYQFGETFKSLFDIYEKRIDVSRVVSKVSAITEDPLVLNKGRPEQLWVALRYLHNYKVKCPEAECADLLPMSPEILKGHRAAAHGRGPDVEVYRSIPDDPTYYGHVRLAFEDERRVVLIKKISGYLGAAALGLGFLLGRWLFWVALGVGGAAWLTEFLVRNIGGQKQHVEDVKKFEDGNNLPRTYKELPAARLVISRAVVFPHLAVLILAGTLLILWKVGVL